MAESNPMPWAELRERVAGLCQTLHGSSLWHQMESEKLLADIDAAAPAMSKLEALADCCGELDADNVKNCSIPNWMRVRSYVVAQIQDAWLDYKGAKRD